MNELKLLPYWSVRSWVGGFMSREQWQAWNFAQRRNFYA
ncbi:hypothetical protein C4J89_2044 [Pseudomonas sp. R4-35-07]|nr:hypothetical protein C4J92_2028 [Pseudomonas sp. R3-18-08]AZF20823.1 hypothetical protein C4J91_2073 [Pseudomonas sp. R3-52-08]AZF26154.1 hypothetical protein C4J90_1981 [Pseudomonas sp. R2-60-08W]AZF31519.1 hypothetical protein C4J89_2044 [Pseudomonas sp. R4-35-07]AZF36796.1 hypothetical protein C4J88_2013 [Pseudomonas sp. R4-39-08]AZF52463.1 hypothetical protein C4J85_1978 [Pseudomonas sp. R4-34-07]